MYRGVKRALDFITALLALIVLSPLLAITALAVKLDSKGPAIFKQQRLGLHGKTFGFINSAPCAKARSTQAPACTAVRTICV